MLIDISQLSWIDLVWFAGAVGWWLTIFVHLMLDAKTEREVWGNFLFFGTILCLVWPIVFAIGLVVLLFVGLPELPAALHRFIHKPRKAAKPAGLSIQKV